MKTARKILFIGLAFAGFKICIAQKNIINVPTSEAVEKNDFYFQQQDVITGESIDASAIFTYGFGKGFEAGISVQQAVFKLKKNEKIFELDREEPEENPDILINAQKIFKVQDAAIAFGTISGTNITQHKSNISFSTFSYINTCYTKPGTQNSFMFGTYFTNREYAGDGNDAGIMAGVQWDIMPDKLTFIADFISGTNSIAATHAGFQIPVFKKWQFAVAAEIPNPGSKNSVGAVIQLAKK